MCEKTGKTGFTDGSPLAADGGGFHVGATSITTSGKWEEIAPGYWSRPITTWYSANYSGYLARLNASVLVIAGVVAAGVLATANTVLTATDNDYVVYTAYALNTLATIAIPVSIASLVNINRKLDYLGNGMCSYGTGYQTYSGSGTPSDDADPVTGGNFYDWYQKYGFYSKYLNEAACK